MTEPLTPRASPSDSGIVQDCPTCKRVIWANARCLHGIIPLEPAGINDDAHVLMGAAIPRKGRLKGGRP